MKLEFSHQLPVIVPTTAVPTLYPLPDSNCCLSHFLRKAHGCSCSRGESDYPHSHHSWLAHLWPLVKVISFHTQHLLKQGGNCDTCAGYLCWVILKIVIKCHCLCGIEQNRGNCLPSQSLIWCLRDQFWNLVSEILTVEGSVLGRDTRRGCEHGGAGSNSLLWETATREAPPGRVSSQRMVSTKVFCLVKAEDWRGLTGCMKEGQQGGRQGQRDPEQKDVWALGRHRALQTGNGALLLLQTQIVATKHFGEGESRIRLHI